MSYNAPRGSGQQSSKGLLANHGMAALVLAALVVLVALRLVFGALDVHVGTN